MALKIADLALQLIPSVTFVDHTLDREIFMLKKKSSKNFSLYVAVRPIREVFLTVDGYNMNENQVSLAVMLWLSGQE